jgi:hypothetical protein
MRFNPIGKILFKASRLGGCLVCVCVYVLKSNKKKKKEKKKERNI